MEWLFNNDAPIYIQLAERIRRRIVSGEYAPGDRLPGVRELASEAQINPNTVQRAMLELERMGLVYSQRASGRNVTEDLSVIQLAREVMAAELTDKYLQSMKELGFTVEDTMKLLSGKEN